MRSPYFSTSFFSCRPLHQSIGEREDEVLLDDEEKAEEEEKQRGADNGRIMGRLRETAIDDSFDMAKRGHAFRIDPSKTFIRSDESNFLQLPRESAILQLPPESAMIIIMVN
jgi:hypothetical protein